MAASVWAGPHFAVLGLGRAEIGLWLVGDPPAKRGLRRPGALPQAAVGVKFCLHSHAARLAPAWSALWPELEQLCRSRRAVFLKVEPDQADPLAPALQAHLAGFQPAPPVQPLRTVLVSLEGGEQDWLARMKHKTRYNIRLAERKGIVVRPSTDLETFQKLMEITGPRDGFGVHSLAYYRRAYDLFSARGQCALLQAEFEGRPLAALMVFASGVAGLVFLRRLQR